MKNITHDEYTCANCNKWISRGIWWHSINELKISLCMDCQKEKRKEVYPEKLATFLNDKLDTTVQN